MGVLAFVGASSSLASMGQSGLLIPTFHSELNKILGIFRFVNFWAKKEGFGSINRFDPPYFWPYFLLNLF